MLCRPTVLRKFTGLSLFGLCLVVPARGSAQTAVAFAPKENFMANFLRLLGDAPRIAEVHFLEPIAANETEGRRRIAELARERIVAAMAS